MLKIIALIFALSSAVANAKNIIQSGNVTPGHGLMWVTDGVAADAGTAAQGFLTSLGVTAQGPGICQNSGPITSGYNQICLGVSSNGGGFVSFYNYGGTGGFNFLINGTSYPFPPTIGGPPRIALTGPTTFYVSNSGNDVNNCLTLSKACQTLQHVIALLQASYDLANNVATIQLADGTYAGTVCESPFTGLGNVAITGDAATPTNVIVQGGTVQTGAAFFVSNGCTIAVTNLEMAAPTFDLFAYEFGAIYANNVYFAATSPSTQGSQISAQRLGYIEVNDEFILGSAASHVSESHMGNVRMDNGTLTLLGNITVGTASPGNELAFAAALDGGDITFTNYVINLNGFTVTGTAYWTDGSWLQSSVNLPGTIPGSGISGGRYNGAIPADFTWPGIAATPFTPTITATTGTITTVSATGFYKQFGKLVYVNVDVAITTNGSGGGALSVTLPVTSAYTSPSGDVLTGVDANNAKAMTCSVSATVCLASLYDGTYPGSSGHSYNISGVYYAQ